MVNSRVLEEERGTCATGGLAGRLPPEVAAGLGALSRVARALNSPGALDELAAHALEEMRSALGLSAAVLYLPDSRGRPMLRRYIEDVPPDSGIATREELVFEEEAWRLAVTSAHPLVFQDTGSWVVANPFEPQARHWLALPMMAAGELLGVVIASRSVPVDLDPTSLTVLMLLGDQLTAGIATARLRQQLQHAELERERMRLAAEVHDGLAQDLALAMRELALLESDPPADVAAASRERLREAVAEAHRLVRARLVDLSSPVPLGGLRSALEEVCVRFEHRGMSVHIDAPGDAFEVPPDTTAVVIRVLNEALTNVEKHAHAGHVDVSVSRSNGWLELQVADDGDGFEAGSARAAEGHLGLDLMRRRAEDAGGTLDLRSAPGRGTAVTLRIAVDET
jgi:two-component system, NarL family, nitrate/nitrite sensor histidine kinase NarX